MSLVSRERPFAPFVSRQPVSRSEHERRRRRRPHTMLRRHGVAKNEGHRGRSLRYSQRALDVETVLLQFVVSDGVEGVPQVQEDGSEHRSSV